MRPVEPAVGERLASHALRANSTRQEAHRGIHKSQGRDLPAGQNKIAQREFCRFDESKKTFVDRFVVAAHEDEPVKCCEILGHEVIEALARGRWHDHRASVRYLELLTKERLHTGDERTQTQNHTGTAAVWGIIGALACGHRAPQVVQRDLHQAFCLCTANDAACDNWFEKIRKQCDDIYLHKSERFSNGSLRRPLRAATRAMSQFDDGIVAFERGDFNKAAALFTAAISDGDNVAAALSKRGVCRLKWGDSEEAERDFRQAIAVDDRCLSAMVNLGNLMLERGSFDDAQVYYNRALRIDETYAFAHYNLGVLHRKRGDLAASIRELRLAAKYEVKSESIKKRLAWRKKRG